MDQQTSISELSLDDALVLAGETQNQSFEDLEGLFDEDLLVS